jgi:hypothetical protein
MATRRRPPSRAPAARVRVMPPKQRKGTPRPVAAHRTYTPELIANIRHRYVETPEPVVSMAADLGIHPSSVHRLARSRGWVRRNQLPPRGMPPALRILEEAKALETATAPRPGGATATATDGIGEAAPRVTLPLVGRVARARMRGRGGVWNRASMRRQTPPPTPPHKGEGSAPSSRLRLRVCPKRLRRPPSSGWSALWWRSLPPSRRCAARSAACRRSRPAPSAPCARSAC